MRRARWQRFGGTETFRVQSPFAEGVSWSVICAEPGGEW